LNVPLKYYHVISQQGTFFRNLRSMGVQVDQSTHPQKPAPLFPPSESTTSIARIDDAEEDTTAVENQWKVVLNYQDAEEGDSEWTLRARDRGALETAEKLIKDAIEQAQKMTHIGFLTLTDRSAFPRIVGARGANVARLRVETGADITVGKDNNTIVIIGTSANYCHC
jgi:hypothetical protein